MHTLFQFSLRWYPCAWKSLYIKYKFLCFTPSLKGFPSIALEPPPHPTPHPASLLSTVYQDQDHWLWLMGVNVFHCLEICAWLLLKSSHTLTERHNERVSICDVVVFHLFFEVVIHSTNWNQLTSLCLYSVVFAV